MNLLSSLRPPPRQWWFVAALVALPLLVHAPFLLGILTIDPLPYVARTGEAIAQWKKGVPFNDPNVGWQAQALGKLSADLWLSGEVPWWNPYNGAGLPLAAEAQPGSFFLPFVLLYHFRLGIVWVAVLLQIIAGLGTYALLRKIRLTALAAFVGALLYEFNGTFAWHGAPAITPIAFLPLLLLAIEHLHARVQTDRPGGWIWIAPVLAWSLYAGFPETAYINGLLAGVWVLARGADLARARWLPYVRGLLYGVGCGLLLSLPMVVPFFEMISLSYIGDHDGAFAHVSMPLASATHSLMPWLFGPTLAYSDIHNAVLLSWIWSGGYLPALQVVVALLGVWLAPRKLSFFLLGWMALCLGKSFDWRPISDLVNLIPMVTSAGFARYAPPSWEMVGAVLCALAIHAMQQTQTPWDKRRSAITVLAVWGVSAWLLYETADPIKAVLRRDWAPWLAIVWLAVSIGSALAVFLLAKKQAFRARGLACLLIVDALLAFVMPLGSSGPRMPPTGEGVAWLQRSQIGFQRIYGMGPIAANYGAYFKLPQINHNYLPAPNAWLSFVRDSLYPQADSISFFSFCDDPNPAMALNAAAALRKNLAAYERIGVRYVVVKPGFELFTDVMKTEHADGHRPLALDSVPALTVNLPLSEQARGRTVDQISVMLGNYGSTANGKLRVQVCHAAMCVEGERPLSESIDNSAFAIALDRPLPVTGESTQPAALAIRIWQEAATHPAAIWMWPLPQNATGQGLTVHAIPDEFAGMGPKLEIRYAQDEHMPPRVYQGRDMDIYELQHPAPYFETSDARCQLVPASRLRLSIQCPSATTLTRKEMHYPGWRASIDGRDTPITVQDGLLQSVQVPKGKHLIVFSYTPSYRPLWLGGFLTGVAILLLNFWRAFRNWRGRAAG
ncbi:MAG: YfhO family protein [Burkholderiaceae bacterium]|jgi:hypothetical protein|nr:YfhO family protein [Burkholderiaceae bacterium]